MNSEKTSKKKILSGTVLGRAGENTVKVQVTFVKTHPKYRKQYTTQNKYLVHDEKNEYQAGDKVEIQESTPRSKNKKWTVIKKIK